MSFAQVAWLSATAALLFGVAVALAAVLFFVVTRPKRCPDCGRAMHLTVEAGASRKKFRCRHCGKTLRTGIPVTRGR